MNLTQTINHKLNGYRILIVEDNELNQLVIKEILQRAKHSTLVTLPLDTETFG